MAAAGGGDGGGGGGGGGHGVGTVVAVVAVVAAAAHARSSATAMVVVIGRHRHASQPASEPGLVVAVVVAPQVVSQKPGPPLVAGRGQHGSGRWQLGTHSPSLSALLFFFFLRAGGFILPASDPPRWSTGRR